MDRKRRSRGPKMGKKRRRTGGREGRERDHGKAGGEGKEEQGDIPYSFTPILEKT